VAAVLSELPPDHPARIAYCSGAREASSMMALTHLLTDRMDLVAWLMIAYNARVD
jgi:hypothetical protein